MDKEQAPSRNVERIETSHGTIVRFKPGWKEERDRLDGGVRGTPVYSYHSMYAASRVPGNNLPKHFTQRIVSA